MLSRRLARDAVASACGLRTAPMQGRAVGSWNALLPHDRVPLRSGRVGDRDKSERVGEPESRYVLPARTRVHEQPPGDLAGSGDEASRDGSGDGSGNASGNASGDGSGNERSADLPRRWRRMTVRRGTAVPHRVEQEGAEKSVYVVVPESDLHALRDAIDDGRQQAQTLSHRLLAKGPQHVRDFQLARHLREHLTRLLDWFDDEA